MTTSEDEVPDAALDRLVDALVSWGATASQIVAHMELTQRSRSTCAEVSTVEAFTGLLRGLARPLVRGGLPLDDVAEAIEAIDEEVCEQVLFVALPGGRRGAPRRRRPV